MELFGRVFGVVLAICAGVILLTLFSKLMNLVERPRRAIVVRIDGLLNGGRMVNIHFANGKQISAVMLVGFTNEKSTKGMLPYQFIRMLVCETSTGSRMLIRPDAVRIIEEIESPAATT